MNKVILDVHPEHLTLVRKILKSHAPSHTVWAHGSRVKGSAHPGSDLDLVILDSAEYPALDVLSALKTAFRESNLPIAVDIALWSDVPEALQQTIRDAHAVVHTAACKNVSR